MLNVLYVIQKRKKNVVVFKNIKFNLIVLIFEKGKWNGNCMWIGIFHWKYDISMKNGYGDNGTWKMGDGILYKLKGIFYLYRIFHQHRFPFHFHMCIYTSQVSLYRFGYILRSWPNIHWYLKKKIIVCAFIYLTSKHKKRNKTKLSKNQKVKINPERERGGKDKTVQCKQVFKCE